MSTVIPWEHRLPICPDNDERYAAMCAGIAEWRALAALSATVPPAKEQSEQEKSHD